MNVNNKYKVTELGEISSDWQLVDINSITTEHKQGYYTKEPYSNEGIKLIRITDLDNQKVDYSNMPKLDISEADYESYKVVPGDFLFARSGAIGRYGIVRECDEKAIFASYIIRFRFDQSKVLNDFIGYFYQSYYSEKQIKKITQGSSNININANNIKSLKIPLPPLKEQQKISEILSTVDEQIKQTDQLIEKTTELKKGLMQQLLTRGIGHTEFKQSELGEIPVEWYVVAIKEVATTMSGGTPNRSNKSYYEDGTIPWVKTGELKNKYIGNVEEFITDEAIKNSSAKIIEENSVVLAMYGATIGQVSILSFPAATNQACCAVISSDKIYYEYLYYYLKSKKDYLISLGAGGAQPNISQKIIQDIKIILPPIQEQYKMTEILSSVDEEIEGYKEEKAKYEELKKGLMQQLLTGKKRVKV